MVNDKLMRIIKNNETINKCFYKREKRKERTKSKSQHGIGEREGYNSVGLAYRIIVLFSIEIIKKHRPTYIEPPHLHLLK